jgi:hypothetical protein
MRPMLIVINPPRFNLLSRIEQRHEHLCIQTFTPALKARAQTRYRPRLVRGSISSRCAERAGSTLGLMSMA